MQESMASFAIRPSLTVTGINVKGHMHKWRLREIYLLAKKGLKK